MTTKKVVDTRTPAKTETAPATTPTRKKALDVTITGTHVIIDFANGERLDTDVAALPDNIRAMGLLHGIKQKQIDAAAISRNPETGRPASVADKYEAVKVVYDRLMGGEWNAVRGEGGGSVRGLLFQALCRMYEGRKTPDDIREFLDGKSKTEQAALRGNPKVAEIIETIRAEAASDSGVDTDAMLDELS